MEGPTVNAAPWLSFKQYGVVHNLLAHLLPDNQPQRELLWRCIHRDNYERVIAIVDRRSLEQLLIGHLLSSLYPCVKDADAILDGELLLQDWKFTASDKSPSPLVPLV
jgi:hypothetical protein